MCGRYASFTPPDTIARFTKALRQTPNAAPSWNVAPSQEAMVVRLHPQTGERRLDLLRWGLVPHWSMDPKNERKPINARAETVATTPMFRDAFACRRCLVPADAFYEWQKLPGGAKQPYAIARADGQPLTFAGVWEGWRGPAGEILRTFAIIVTAANGQMKPIHDRMPVIVEPDDWPLWLGEVAGDPAKLLPPRDDLDLNTWPVSRRVNSPTNNDAGLLEPDAVPRLTQN
jgi:putative SOS response-associated peptidase YedK